MENLMECIFAIHGLHKYIPVNIIQTYIIPYAIEKPSLYCKKCGKILYLKTQTKQETLKPLAWVIFWKNVKNIETLEAEKVQMVSCRECFNKFFNQKKIIRNN
jgi:hypothetical protein